MIATIILARQLGRITRVRQESRKVDHSIERATRLDPFVQLLPPTITPRARVRLSGTTERSDRGAKHRDASSVRVSYDLLEGRLESIRNAIRGASVCAAVADVVDTFEDHDVLDALLLERVALVAGQKRGTETTRKDGVATGCLVVHANVGEAVLLHPC